MLCVVRIIFRQNVCLQNLSSSSEAVWRFIGAHWLNTCIEILSPFWKNSALCSGLELVHEVGKKCGVQWHTSTDVWRLSHSSVETRKCAPAHDPSKTNSEEMHTYKYNINNNKHNKDWSLGILAHKRCWSFWLSVENDRKTDELLSSFFTRR